MEKDSLRANNNNNNNNISSNNTHKTDGLTRSSSVPESTRQTTSDFVLQWGSRKRLRCMKVKDDSSPAVHRTTVRVDRRVVRADKDAPLPNPTTANGGYFNLRHRPSSPQPPPSHHRILRNSENHSAMRGGQSNGGVRGRSSPERGAHDKRSTANHHHHHSSNGHHHENNNKSGASSETAQDSKKGGSSSGGSGEAAPPVVWPPKFMIALTNKEKEEDFIAFKGSKLPQRPKKRAKFIQRTLNLVSPGAWLCDLTLERYEVREKKVTKKRPRGLKAMNNMDSDSE